MQLVCSRSCSQQILIFLPAARREGTSIPDLPPNGLDSFPFQNGQIRQLTCILLMSYCSVSGGTGGGGLFAPLTHDQSMQFLTVVQPHRLRLLLQPLIPVQLAQVGQVGLWKRSAQTSLMIDPCTLKNLSAVLDLDEMLILLYIKVEMSAHVSL